MQESKLPSGMVNKLGDPCSKIAPKAGYLLASLLEEHPAMPVSICTEVCLNSWTFYAGEQAAVRDGE